MKSQILIAAPCAGSGKTVVTLGLLRVLQRRKLKVQPFKCGPDCFDGWFHAIAARERTVNLDTFMASKTHVQQVYNKYGEQADVCVVDGTKGLLDGYNRMQGSTAELAQVLDLPVVLVVNARALSYSVAPLLYGFRCFRPAPRLVGVIFNQVASPAHYACLKDACVAAGVMCLGYVPVLTAQLPSRHTALTLEVPAEVLVEEAAAQLEAHVDIDRLLSLTTRIFPCNYTLPYTSDVSVEHVLPSASKRWRIAVARDSACNFLFRENIDRLHEIGDVTFFSLMYSKVLPPADIIYLPGGYPELFARFLHRRAPFLRQLRDFAEAGGRLLAEDGGMAVIARTITIREGGTPYAMAGILPLDLRMEHDVQPNAGYRVLTCGGQTFRGYEQHYTRIMPSDIQMATERLANAKGIPAPSLLYRYKNVVASHVRWYWGEADFLNFWQ